MTPIRIMHYVNQFFAGLGGEDKAGVPVDSREGPLGPGQRLQELLGDSAKIVVTAYCGDNYFSEHRDEALTAIQQIVKDYDVKVVVAGPAFASGRYGVACAEVCHFLTTQADLDCVSAMHVDNPAVDIYRQYKDRRVFLFSTTASLPGMEDALSRMAQFLLKLAAGATIGSASEEVYIPRGIRLLEVVPKSGAERAVDMLLNKLAGRSFTSEVPVEIPEAIPPTPRIANLGEICLALATESGVVPQGNPDGFKTVRNTHWKKYSIDNLHSMQDAKWEVIHGGYTTVFMHNNPNYGVPLDVCRELEREGTFARLYRYFYVTVGNLGSASAMQAIGREMADDMKAEGVDAVLLVST